MRDDGGPTDRRPVAAGAPPGCQEAALPRVAGRRRQGRRRSSWRRGEDRCGGVRGPIQPACMASTRRSAAHAPFWTASRARPTPSPRLPRPGPSPVPMSLFLSPTLTGRPRGYTQWPDVAPCCWQHMDLAPAVCPTLTVRPPRLPRPNAPALRALSEPRWIVLCSRSITRHGRAADLSLSLASTVPPIGERCTQSGTLCDTRRARDADATCDR